MTHRNRISFHDGRGAAFTVSREHEAPTLISNKYMLFGKVTAVMAAATGRGLITAMVLKSDSGDEIDWVRFLPSPQPYSLYLPSDETLQELLGAYDDQASSNYFYDGQALFNTYNTTYTLRNASLYHSYTVEWTDKFLAFSIDGSVRRAWRLGDIPPDKWPQTPMQVKLGVWAVARDSDKGEIAWAGGLPDWNEPHTAYVKTLEMTDYAGYCDDIRAADAEYQYDERTVGWQDVRIAGCKRRSGTPLQTPRPATPSATDESGGAAAVVSWFLAAAAWLVAF